MSQDYPPMSRTFRITIDVEAALCAPRERGETSAAGVAAERELLLKLLGRPDILERFMRFSATTMVEPALRRLHAQYRAEGTPEQELLRPLIEELTTEEREAFVVGREDAFFGERADAQEYYYEPCTARVLSVEMREVGEE